MHTTPRGEQTEKTSDGRKSEGDLQSVVGPQLSEGMHHVSSEKTCFYLTSSAFALPKRFSDATLPRHRPSSPALS